MRKLPLLAMVLLTSCQYIPQFLMENPFAAKIVEEVVEDIAEEIADEIDGDDSVKSNSSKDEPKKDPILDCPTHLKAI